MREIIVDLSFVYSKDDLHDALKASLELPDYYGRNLDALYDCLSTMYMYDEVCLVLVGTENLPEDMLPYAGKLIDVLDQVTDEYKHSGDSEFKYEIREPESASYVTPIPIIEKYPEISDDDIMGISNPFKKDSSNSPFKPASPFAPVASEEPDFPELDDMTDMNDGKSAFAPAPFDSADVADSSVSASSEVLAEAEPAVPVETVAPVELSEPLVQPSVQPSVKPSISVAPVVAATVAATETSEPDEDEKVPVYEDPSEPMAPTMRLDTLSSNDFYSDKEDVALFEDESVWDELIVKTMIRLRSYGDNSSLDKIAASEILQFQEKIPYDRTSEVKFLFMKYEANTRGELSRRRGIYSLADAFFRVEETLNELFEKFVTDKKVPDDLKNKYDVKKCYREYMTTM